MARGRLTMPALKHAMAIWFKKFFPLHFTRQAFYRYPNVYKRRRSKRQRDPRPLIETGDLWSRLVRSARITGTRKRATLRMRGTWYLRPQGRYANRQPDKPAEITAVNRAELVYLRRVIARSLQAGIAREKHSRHYRIGGTYNVGGLD